MKIFFSMRSDIHLCLPFVNVTSVYQTVACDYLFKNFTFYGKF